MTSRNNVLIIKIYARMSQSPFKSVTIGGVSVKETFSLLLTNLQLPARQVGMHNVLDWYEAREHCAPRFTVSPSSKNTQLLLRKIQMHQNLSTRERMGGDQENS